MRNGMVGAFPGSRNFIVLKYTNDSGEEKLERSVVPSG